jgi:Ca2+-binding EF-hand superfamily protein
MLVAMKKVDKELFDDLHDQFVQLDPTGDGQITKSDLIIMARRRMKTLRHKMELSEYKVDVH